MSLLQDLLKEMAAAGATAAAGVAAAPGSLFGGGVVRRKKKKKVKEAYRLNPSEVIRPKHQNVWDWRIIGEMMEMGKGQREETTFDPADVMSKLKNAEDRIDNEDDTVPFGLEDEDGNLVKVYVRAEQADEFESTLASMLAGEDADPDDDGELENQEIAEVLFQLKDKFDIVDVEWPEIQGDEEEEAEVQPGGEEGDLEGGTEGEGGPEGEGGMEDLGGEGEGGMEDIEGMEDLGGEGEGGMEMEPEGGAESALQQVIDMMKADAEARKAESEARAKEAEARAAEANASAASSKVKQEEQVLDMESYNDQKKSEEEEAKRLAKLAKWKHDQASAAETKMAEEEEESLQQERTANQQQETQPISVQTLADELIRRLQGSIR